MPRGQSLYHKYPNHRVDVEPETRRVRVKRGGAIIAESEATLTVLETNHDPVTYFPRQDVRFDFLEATSHQTFCPFKGDASYWSIRVGDDLQENSVWSYQDPFPQVERLKGYLAFYPDRVEWEYD